ncbi:Sulfurtransferase TusD [Candidatus Profftia lariciata]|uniref:sulfurtransferase complex subunit TusD n=1 Tax=Candidatus Profftia lariciata TaxID=1987921 RepID=UPI001D027429|nr:sulfurtransferase complex subunit TusD [Candidatus Profftia lariciata]UDG81576.1 Sulfurtransferase TusD [Candidatus Profftia lariciata]
MLSYTLLVNGPAYGTQAASSAYQFAQAIIMNGYRLISIFFYREGVTNANKLIFPINNEFNLVCAWYSFAKKHDIKLYVCIIASLRRGIISYNKDTNISLTHDNIHDGFILSGLGLLMEAMLNSDRFLQF